MTTISAKVAVALIALIALSGCGAADSTMPAVYVAGDSIGVGIAQAAHLPSVAKEGAPMSRAAAQLAGVPMGAIVIVSLGTNDAVAGKTSAPIAPYEAIAKQRNLRLVWVGPPCMLTTWASTAAKFSAWLDRHVQHHIALPDCMTAQRAGDGIHFTMTGYARLWATIRRRANG